MSKKDYENLIDPMNLSVDEILAEYKAEIALTQQEENYYDSSPSRKIEPESAGEIETAQISEPKQGEFELDFDLDRALEPEPEPLPTQWSKRWFGKKEQPAEPEPVPEPDIEPAPPPSGGTEDDLALDYDYGSEGYSDEDEADYASDDDYGTIAKKQDEQDEPEEKSDRDRLGFMRPIISLMAAVTVRRQERAKAGESLPETGPEENEGPDMPPSKAAKLYSSQVQPFKLRAALGGFVALIMVYISFAHGSGALPASISKSTQMGALMLLMMELAVVLIGLDVFTNGLFSLLRGNPGAESLVSVSCIVTMVDAVIIAATGSEEYGLPYCAVSALSLVFAMLGSSLFCRGMRITLRTAAMGSAPSVLSSERGIIEEGTALLKTRRGTAGFTRRCEEPDGAETAFSTAAPFFLIAIPLLALLTSVVRGRAGDFFHCLAAMAAVSAAFPALLSFPLPFSIISRRLAGSGASVAGWAGASDIGTSRRMIVTDTDVFPAGTVTISTIRILEGVFSDKVISFTGSMLLAADCSLTPAFAELMKRNACTTHVVEDFKSHEGGGVIGMVRGEQVYVGTSGFMNLMGIRLPQSQLAKDCVFTAISGELVGVYSIEYAATASVQDALVSLLHTRGCEPLFAIRDFNVSPLLIKQLFRLPTEGFDFPSVSERYRISAATAGETQIAAVVSREGLAPMVEASIGGRGLYRASRLGIIISLLCSIAGLGLMLMLCWNASFDSATAANLITYMLAWLIPVILISFGSRR